MILQNTQQNMQGFFFKYRLFIKSHRYKDNVFYASFDVSCQGHFFKTLLNTMGNFLLLLLRSQTFISIVIIYLDFFHFITLGSNEPLIFDSFRQMTWVFFRIQYDLEKFAVK